MNYGEKSVVTIHTSSFNNTNNGENQLDQNFNNIKSKKEINKRILNLKSNNEINSKFELVWFRVIGFIVLHLGAIYGLYIIIFEEPKLGVLGLIGAIISIIGVTAGAHRLWTHKAYKAKWQMKLILMILQSMAYQNSLWEWARDHRVHHKFTDTDADPHNSRRGFFFCHMGWLMIKKHPDVKLKGKTIDMSDLEADYIVMLQKKYFYIIMPLFCFIVPTLIPYYVWGYSFKQSFYVCSIWRYIISLHGTWFVNSAAHLWGSKPYDKSINPSDNRFVISFAQGEGYHNYHHVFPWDYKAAEMGSYFFNLTKVFIDSCAKIGWAYDLKTTSEDMIRKRVLRTGDGSHKISMEDKKLNDLIKHLNHENEENLVWGWDDKDMDENDRKNVIIINRD